MKKVFAILVTMMLFAALTLNAALADATATPAPVKGEYITVFRGETDANTIMFNDNQPGYYADDPNLTWYDADGYAMLHMLGGTYVVPCDGIISGDVKVDGKEIYDNDGTTFLVIPVKKGAHIYANHDYGGAWFTNRYSEELIVDAVQTQFPTWTRQDTK